MAGPGRLRGDDGRSRHRYGRDMFEHTVIEVGGLSKGSVVKKVQAELDTRSAEGWELVTVTEQAPTTLSVRLFFKRPRG